MDALSILKETLSEVFEESHAEALKAIEQSRQRRADRESEPMILKTPQPESNGSILGITPVELFISGAVKRGVNNDELKVITSIMDSRKSAAHGGD